MHSSDYFHGNFQDPIDDKSNLIPAITWASADPDLFRHMSSLGNNGLIQENALGIIIRREALILVLGKSFQAYDCTV